MNQYPLWKYILIVIIVLASALYALPNLFGEDPAVQISPASGREVQMDDSVKKAADLALERAHLRYESAELSATQLMLRFQDTDSQLKAYSVLKEAIPGYVVAQNLAPATPHWLTSLFGAKPMYLGLDLRGGVHFLMQVDMEAAVRQDEEQYVNELRTLFREQKIRLKSINRVVESGGIQAMFADAGTREQARQLLAREYGNLVVTPKDTVNEYGLFIVFSPLAIQEKKGKAVEQNVTTLRNRVNELGVAEPVIQRQGEDRIVVQLPGVQDTARAKEILGATATLEFRLVADPNESKMNTQSYKRREGGTIMLKRSVVVTGDQINDASQGIDQHTNSPATHVRLDSQGAKRMMHTTRENVGKPMAVVFIEYKTESQMVGGKQVKIRKKVEEVINVATIQDEFGKNFQITGLSSGEARNLALLLRAGALSAPVEIIEERTIGPSLGQENINKGMMAIFLSFITVMIFMWLRYSTFGMVANFALLMNVVILIALLSMIQATLTLPGMAGIVLTLGMAVDANVLIYERIREEIHNGNSPQNSINAGFEKAWGTIADSNITTLIAGIVLFGFGTGPIKGFAVVLSLGIITSMFTAVMVSRAVINYFYGGKKLTKLPV